MQQHHHQPPIPSHILVTNPNTSGGSPFFEYQSPPPSHTSIPHQSQRFHSEEEDLHRDPTHHQVHDLSPYDNTIHRSIRSDSRGGMGLSRAPSLHLLDEDPDDLMHEEHRCCANSSCCRSCACARCLSHCWFLAACCGFILLSSLPRILTLVDFIISILMYSLSFEDQSQPSLSFWEFLKRDFNHYSFQYSGGSLVILSFIRMLILFFTYAYRFHLQQWAFITATITAAISVLFTLVKFALSTNPHELGLLIWSLTISTTEYIVWLALRRQRIKHPHVRLDGIDTHAPLTAAATASTTSGRYLLTPRGQSALMAGHSTDEEHDESSTTGALLMEAGMRDHTSITAPGLLPSTAFPSSGSVPRSLATDILPSARQAQSYQRLGGSDDDHPSSSAPQHQRMSHSFITAQSFGSLGASTGASSLLFPRLGPPSISEREVNPLTLAEPDSLFMQIDSLQVHLKLAVNGVSIIGRGDIEKQARDAVTAALTDATRAAAAQTRSSDDALNFAVAQGVEQTHLSGVATYSADATPITAAASTTHPQQRPFPHPMVLLHGFGNSLFQWQSVWSTLASQCTVLLAFDRPGFGLTSRPLKDANGGYGSYVTRNDESNGVGGRGGQLREQQNPYTAEYSQYLLLTLLSKLGITQHHPALFVGHSTGATVALRSAIAAPSRCLGLFLVSPHILTTGFPDLIKSLLKTKLGALITQQLVRSEMGEVALKRAWYDASNIPPHILANYQRSLQLKNHMESLIEMASASSTGADSSSGRDPLPNLALHLHNLSSTQPLLPICILHGIQDRLVDISESVRVFKQLKNEGALVTLIKVDHCGHCPHEEFPSLFLEHLFGFCQELESNNLSHNNIHSNGNDTIITTPMNDSYEHHRRRISSSVGDEREGMMRQHEQEEERGAYSYSQQQHSHSHSAHEQEHDDDLRAL
jgi:pimeloyl-ACP methyl ester carboxylesterase